MTTKKDLIEEAKREFKRKFVADEGGMALSTSYDEKEVVSFLITYIEKAWEGGEMEGYINFEYRGKLPNAHPGRN